MKRERIWINPTRHGFFYATRTIYFLMTITALVTFSTNIYAEPRTSDDLIEISCGIENQNSKRILIAYDTIHGSTAEVAEYIGNELCNLGHQVDVQLASNVTDVNLYDAVIVGSAIYQFDWLEGAKEFLQQSQTVLSKLPTAYFVVGASMSEDTPENREEVIKIFVDPILEEFADITPLSIGLFGGVVDFNTNQYNLFEKIVLRILGKLLGYRDNADWRNWETISSWTKDISEQFVFSE